MWCGSARAGGEEASSRGDGRSVQFMFIAVVVVVLVGVGVIRAGR